jgi:cell division septum initiation protein DivIVA
VATYLDSSLQPYNPRAYVPGGSSKKKARAIVAQGKKWPVKKPPKNPNIRTTPGGGSSPSSTASPGFSDSAVAGAGAQTRAAAAKPAVKPTLDVNYEADPILARIKAIGSKSVGEAASLAEAERKQAIIDTGLTDVGREVGVDENTLTAAAQNPLSLSAQLANEFSTRGRDLNESLNQANLFYSGHRADQLAELERSRMSEQSDLVRNLRSVLGGIDSGVLEAQELAAFQEQQAIEEAAARASEEAYYQALLDALAGTGYEEEAPVDPVAASLAPLDGDPYYDQSLAMALATPWRYGRPSMAL